MTAWFDSLDPQALGVLFLAAAVAFGVLALVVAWRNWSDNRACRTTRPQLPAHLPYNFRSGWDRVDEHERPY